MAFYDISNSERIAMTNTAIAARQTLTERWRALDRSEADPWSERAAQAARLLAGLKTIVDFGCGTMTLERYLDKDVVYRPVDVVARDQRTIVCDFNTEPLPNVDADGAACLGVIEYLFDVRTFLTRLAKFYPVAAVSYCVASEDGAVDARRANAWVNDLTRPEIEALFSDVGFEIQCSVDVGAGQILWLLRSA